MEESDFLREMEARPGDITPALVFADWLEENGKPAHGEIVRLHHEPGNGHAVGGNRASFGLSPPTVKKFSEGVTKQFEVPKGLNGSSSNKTITFLARLPEPRRTYLYNALKEESGEISEE